MHCIVTALDDPARPVLIELRENLQQRKLNREQRLLDQSVANKELIRNLAHEIKNPLGGIRGAAQLLELELPELELAERRRRELREYTQVIIKEADRLQTLVDRLLAPHRRAQVVGDVNIHEVCERVRSLILAEFPHGLTITRDYDLSVPEFRGDKEQLIQAVLNVARNAAQALAARIRAGDAELDAAQPHRAPGDAGRGALPAGTGLAYHRQWPGHPARNPGTHLLSAGVRRRRQRPRADAGAEFRAAARRRDRVRDPARIYRFQDIAAAAVTARRHTRKPNRWKLNRP